MGGNSYLTFPITPERCLEEQHTWVDKWGTDVCSTCGVVYVPPLFLHPPLPPLDLSAARKEGLARWRDALRNWFPE